MRTKGVFKIAAKSLKSNKMQYAFTAVLLVLCFVLFSVCEFMYVRPQYNRYVADRVLAKGTENTGLIRSIDSGDENAFDFRNEALSLGIVDSIGESFANVSSRPCFNELISIQGGKSEALKTASLESYENFDNDALGYIRVDATLMTLCNLKLQKGEMISKDNFDYSDKNFIAMYLGDSFSDIPVGTEYQYKIWKDVTITVRVMGIIAKGEEWVDESIGSLQGSIEKSKYNLDNEVIMVYNDYSHSRMWFYSLKDGSTMEETQKALYDLAEKHNLQIMVGSVSARFDAVEIQYKSAREILFFLLIFISVISTMIIICFNSVSIISRKKQFGVLLAGGVSKSGLFVSLIIEQAIKIITGLALATLAVYFGSKWYFVERELEAVYDIFLHFVLWKTVVFGLIECVVVSGVSVFILGRYKPVELIKYRY